MNTATLSLALLFFCSQAVAADGGELVGPWTSVGTSSANVSRIDMYYTADGRFFSTTFSGDGEVFTQGGYYIVKGEKVVFADASNDPERRAEVTFKLNDGVLEFTGGSMDMELNRDTRKSPLQE
jgi:hypothetical protein